MVSHEVADSSGVQVSLQVAPSEGSTDLSVGAHPPALASQPLSSQSSEKVALSSQKADQQDVFEDASDGSDIDEFTEDEPSISSSQTISDFSQSQSILRGTQNVEKNVNNNVQNGSVIDGVVISEIVEVIESSDLRSTADVDSMDPSLVSLKRKSQPAEDSRRPRRRSPGSRSKHRRVISASPRGRGRHRGLPAVSSDRPS